MSTELFLYSKDDVHVEFKFKLNNEVILKILTFLIFTQNELIRKQYVVNEFLRFRYNLPLEKGVTV